VWQPGRFVRALTDAGGRYLASVAVPGPADVSVFARGLVQRVVTRVYLSDDEADEVLGTVDPSRRTTLRAVPDGDGLRFDIKLQGQEETVFFAW
jgi:protocatechuate 3,4-dioxygenase alpha subunit